MLCRESPRCAWRKACAPMLRLCERPPPAPTLPSPRALARLLPRDDDRRPEHTHRPHAHDGAGCDACSRRLSRAVDSPPPPPTCHEPTIDTRCPCVVHVSAHATSAAASQPATGRVTQAKHTRTYLALGSCKQHRVIDHLVHLHLHHHLTSTVGELQRAGGLLGTRSTGRHGREHDSARVASQGILKQPCERRVTIRYVCTCRIGESRDAVAEGRQALVDGRVF